MENRLIQVQYGPADLSDLEHLALNFALAHLKPEKFAQPFAFVWQQHVRRVGEGTARRQRNMGMEDLMAKGIIEGQRDGHRDWVPAVIHFEKIKNDRLLIQAGLVTDEGE